MKLRGSLLGLAVLASILALLSFLFLGFDPLNLCADTVKSEEKSPSGSHIATWFVRNCGATTSYVSHVSVRPIWLPFKSDWNIIFTAKDSPNLMLRWRDAESLEIECQTCRPIDKYGEIYVFRQEQTAWGIKVFYKFAEP